MKLQRMMNFSSWRAMVKFEYIVNMYLHLNDPFFLYIGIWDCMSNQEVVDFVRSEIAQDKTLDTICEDIMDNCLANDQTSSGLGYDNMSVMIIAILNGKTEKEWYQWIKEKSSSSNKTTSASVDTINNNNIPDSAPSKLTTATTAAATTTAKTETATSSPPLKE